MIENLSTIQEKGSGAVKLLRKHRLANGLPFMINSKELNGFKCYLEYPDGSIRLVERFASGTDFKEIRCLSSVEAHDLRTRYQLF